MYITLSSINENSNSNYKNHFHDTMDIKPNSYICLATAGFTRQDVATDIGNISSFNFRVVLGSFDFSKNYNVPAGYYTVEELVSYMNGLVINSSPIWNIEFSAEEVENVGEAIVCRWTRTNPFIGKQQYITNFIPAYTLESQIVNALDTANQTDIQTFNGVQWRAAYIRGLLANTYNYNCAVVAPMGTDTVENPDCLMIKGNLNRGAYDINRLQGAMNWITAQPKVDSKFYLGQSAPHYSYRTFDGVVDKIESVELELDYKIKLEYLNTGVVQVTARKRDDTTSVVSNHHHNVSNQIEISTIPYTSPDATVENCYAYRVTSKATTYPTTLWLPLDGIKAIDFGDARKFDKVALQSWYENQNTKAEYNNTVLCQGIYGIRSGLQNGPNSNAINEFGISCTTESVANWGFPFVDVSTVMPNTRSMDFGRVRAAVTQNACIATDTLLPFTGATCFSVGFSPTSDGFSNDMTLAGEGSIDSISINVTTGIVTLQEQGGGANVAITPLLNGTGASIAAYTFGENYLMTIISNDYTGGSTEYYVYVTKSDDTLYFASGTASGANIPIHNLKYFAASDAPTTNQAVTASRFNGRLWDIRFFQYNPISGGGNYTIADFRAQHNAIAIGSVVTAFAGNDKTNDWFNNITEIDTLFDGASEGNGFTDYAVIGQPFTMYNQGLTIIRDSGATPVDINWYDYGAFITPYTRNLANTERTNDIVVTGQVVHQRENLLKIHTDTNDNVLTIGKTPTVNFLTETAYAGGTPSIIETGYTDLTGSGSDTVIAKVTGEKIETNQTGNSEDVFNIEIENLPHRSMKGAINTLSKSIYEIPLSNANVRKIGQEEEVGFVVSNKIWHNLNNPGNLPINSLDVKITDVLGKEVKTLVGPTNVAIEIKTRDEIF